VLLQSLTKTDVLHVPYRGFGTLMADFLAGRVDASIGPGPSFVPLIRTGRIRALGVATRSRSPLLPDVPAISEAVPGYEMENWVGLVAPAATPASVITALHEAVAKSVAEASVHDRLVEQGATPSVKGPHEFAALVKRESESWSRFTKAMNVTAE
ncbi:MAG: tripartite tricarboxylate transporter substrate-binding protein, partial [Tepidisphaeraceae bacterium]